MDDKVEVKSGPRAEDKIVFTLHAGSKVQLRKKNGDWNLINLENGLSGWIKSSSIEKI